MRRASGRLAYETSDNLDRSQIAFEMLVQRDTEGQALRRNGDRCVLELEYWI